MGDIDFGEYIKRNLGKNNYLLSLYLKYSLHYTDMQIIFNRLNKNYDEFLELSKKIPNSIKNKERTYDLIAKINYKFSELGLDIESFYLFTRALLDDISKLIKYLLNSKHLPPKIKTLLDNKNNKYGKYIDITFLNGLKNELSWINNFIHRRDKLLHELDTISISIGSDLKFNVTKLLEPGEFVNLKDFIKEIIDKIESLKLYLMKNRNLYKLN